MSYIHAIHAREIIDSRGNPTLEVEVELNNGICGVASVPSGASTGINEALELRDGDRSRYNGLGVTQAIKNVNEIISPAIKGFCIFDQLLIDQTMCDLDGTENKSHLGANAILGVSLACAKTGASALNQPLFRYIGGVHACRLPLPMMNIINGGVHADSTLDFQELMLHCVGAKNIHEAVQMGCEIFHAIKNILHQKKLSTSVGDEGGFAPSFQSLEEALDVIIQGIKRAHYEPGENVKICIDCAASEFFHDGKYKFKKEGKGREFSPDEMIDYLIDLTEKYPIDSLEDPLAENDWEHWRILTEKIGHKIQIVGDDIFVTNRKYLARGIAEKTANAILIKLNQIGTLSETLSTIEMAHQAGFKCIVSHRSGETEDTTIADLAVAVNCGQIKTGSLSRSERTAKYNQLLRIEELLGKTARFN